MRIAGGGTEIEDCGSLLDQGRVRMVTTVDTVREVRMVTTVETQRIVTTLDDPSRTHEPFLV